ncbi:MAG: hypothetical protein IJP92_00790 [Lachnospiraceae bacterium]|nr:hypothetical protein [Lachnospiraceae bacterium]
MALSRKFLSAMGIEDAKIDEIISAHTDTVNALKEERDNFKADAEKLPAVQKELDDLKKAESKGDAYKVKYEAQKEEYEALKKEFDQYKDGVTAKETTAKKESAYRALLKKAGVSEKRIDAVLRVSDIAKVELTEDGAIKDADEVEKEIKKEWSDFIVSESKKGADTPEPPANNGGNVQKGEAARIAQRYHENLYGKTEETK